MIFGIPLLIKAVILCIQNILEVLLKDIGILKMESVFLHNNILLFFFILYVSLSYYIINICILASITVDDCFSIFTSSFYTACDNILVTRILLKDDILELQSNNFSVMWLSTFHIFLFESFSISDS